jgi:predicted outer membrane repeat protein
MEEEKNRVLRQILGIESEIGRKSTLQLALNQARKLGGAIQGEHVSRT